LQNHHKFAFHSPWSTSPFGESATSHADKLGNHFDSIRVNWEKATQLNSDSDIDAEEEEMDLDIEFAQKMADMALKEDKKDSDWIPPRLWWKPGQNQGLKSWHVSEHALINPLS
jgi:hypothetical protein